MNSILGALLLLVVADSTAQRMLMTKPERFRPPSAATEMVVPPPPVRVLARKEPLQNGYVRYHYRVVNGSPYPITTLVIGYDYFYGTSELPLGPVGFSDKGVPRGSVSSPSGWTFRVVETEEDSLLQYEWEIGSHEQVILGGSQSGFSVVLPRECTANELGHWTVYLDGAQSYYSAKLQMQSTGARFKRSK